MNPCASHIPWSLQCQSAMCNQGTSRSGQIRVQMDIFCRRVLPVDHLYMFVQSLFSPTILHLDIPTSCPVWARAAFKVIWPFCENKKMKLSYRRITYRNLLQVICPNGQSCPLQNTALYLIWISLTSFETLVIAVSLFRLRNNFNLSHS